MHSLIDTTLVGIPGQENVTLRRNFKAALRM